MQLSSTIVKSSESPLVATLLKNTDAEPVFVAVIVCGALVVPVSCEAKVSELGENETAGPVTARALPAPSATTATEATTKPSSGSSRRQRRVALPARGAELTPSFVVNDLPIDRIITIPPSIPWVHAKTAGHEVRIPPYAPDTLGGFLTSTERAFGTRLAGVDQRLPSQRERGPQVLGGSRLRGAVAALDDVDDVPCLCRRDPRRRTVEDLTDELHDVLEHVRLGQLTVWP